MTALTWHQRQQILRDRVRWQSGPAPCGISHEDPFNPCLPEDDGTGLVCLTCWQRHRPAITAGNRNRTGDR